MYIYICIILNNILNNGGRIPVSYTTAVSRSFQSFFHSGQLVIFTLWTKSMSKAPRFCKLNDTYIFKVL